MALCSLFVPKVLADHFCVVHTLDHHFELLTDRKSIWLSLSTNFTNSKNLVDIKNDLSNGHCPYARTDERIGNEKSSQKKIDTQLKIVRRFKC